MIRYLPRGGGDNFCIRVYKDGKHLGNIRKTDTNWYFFKPVGKPRQARQYGTLGEIKSALVKAL